MTKKPNPTAYFAGPEAFSDAQRVLFLESLVKNGGDVKKALDDLSVSLVVALRAYKSDPDFKVAWDEALEAANWVLEHHAVQRSTNGATRKTVNNKGEEVEVEDKASDKMLQTLLKARMPHTYSDRVQVTGAEGGPIQVRDALIERILTQMQGKQDVQSKG